MPFLRQTAARVVFSLLVGATLVAPPAASAATVSWRPDTQYASHSMVYVNSSYAFKRAMFEHAAASGASSIRLDLALTGVFGVDSRRPDWSGVDEITALSREFRLRVTAVILSTPWYLTNCPAGTPFERTHLCAPADPAGEWARQVEQVAARTRGTISHFEIVNEPDGQWAFLGSPADYAAMLVAGSAAIRRANPRAAVLMGGLMHLGSRTWMDQVFAAQPGLASSFDIVNVHVRGRLATLPRVMRSWQRYFASRGASRKPVWVTEFGYASDPAYQRDLGYTDGEAGQARYLRAALPALINAGAGKVFVTLRDNMWGDFASEGILGGNVSDSASGPLQVRRKAAFRALATLGQRAQVTAARASKRRRVVRRK